MSAPPSQRSRWLVVGPLVATAVVYLPGLGGAFLWDDLPLIAQNTFVTDPAQLPALLTRPFWDVSSIDGIGRAAYLNLYRPLVSLAYATQWRLFGHDPLGFHAVSLALHLSCVALAADWIRRRLEGSTRATWLAACLGVLPFALHPSRPEVVSWVSGSTDLYWSLFALCGLRLFERDQGRGTKWMAALCFTLAVLSKETAVVMPIVLAIDHWSRGRRPTWGREGVGALGTLAGVALHFAVVPPASVVSSAPSSSPVLRVLATLGHFAVRTAWPFDPTVGPAARTLDAAGRYVFAPHAVALGAALIVGAALLVGASLRRHRLRAWAGDAALYGLPLLPVSNLIALDGPTLVSDRFLYFSLIGLGAALARAALPAIERGPPKRTAALVLLGGLGLALGAVCARHVRHFGSAEALWASERARDPDSLQALQNSTELALAAGDRAMGVRLMARTLAVATARHERVVAARAGIRLAAMRLQRTSDAEQARLLAFRTMFDGFSSSPRLALRQPDLQLDLELRPREAQALRRDPARFAVPRALAHLRTGQLEEAARQLQLLAAGAPDTPGLWTALATAHARGGDWERALQAAAEGVRRQRTSPGFAAQLGATRRMAVQAVPPGAQRVVRDAEVQNRLGAPEAARRLLEAALREAPGDPALIRARVRADLADGRPDLARAVLERAQTRHPDRAAVWSAMERELAQATGREP